LGGGTDAYLKANEKRNYSDSDESESATTATSSSSARSSQAPSNHDMYVIKVKIGSAENLNLSRVATNSNGNIDSFRPYIVVNVLQSVTDTDTNTNRNENGNENGNENENENVKCISSSVSKQVQGSTRCPVWDEELVLAVDGLSRLVFTVVCGDEKFLGQASVPCRVLPSRASEPGVISDLTLSLTELADPIFRKGSSFERLPGTDEEVSADSLGIIHVTISVPSHDENMCGFLFKISRSIFGTTRGAKTWVMLYDGKMYLYNGPWGTESVIQESPIDCGTILKVVTETYTRTEIPMDGFRVTYNTSRKRDIFVWTIDSRHIENLWMYALRKYR